MSATLWPFAGPFEFLPSSPAPGLNPGPESYRFRTWQENRRNGKPSAAREAPCRRIPGDPEVRITKALSRSSKDGGESPTSSYPASRTLGLWVASRGLEPLTSPKRAHVSRANLRSREAAAKHQIQAPGR